jgi:hypothetical protein
MLEHPLELGLQALAQLGGGLEGEGVARAVDRRALRCCGAAGGGDVPSRGDGRRVVARPMMALV